MGLQRKGLAREEIQFRKIAPGVEVVDLIRSYISSDIVDVGSGGPGADGAVDVAISALVLV